jgi:hypothetical protein
VHFITADTAWQLRNDRRQRLRLQFAARADRRRRTRRPTLTLVDPLPQTSTRKSNAA